MKTSRVLTLGVDICVLRSRGTSKASHVFSRERMLKVMDVADSFSVTKTVQRSNQQAVQDTGILEFPDFLVEIPQSMKRPKGSKLMMIFWYLRTFENLAKVETGPHPCISLIITLGVLDSLSSLPFFKKNEKGRM